MKKSTIIIIVAILVILIVAVVLIKSPVKEEENQVPIGQEQLSLDYTNLQTANDDFSAIDDTLNYIP